MIFLSQQLNEIFDIKNEDELRNFLINVKLCIEELSRKGKAIQQEVRSTVPNTNDISENEDVRYVSGATIRTYTKINGSVRYHAET